MTTFCGRTICNIMSPDGKDKVALFNSMVEDSANIIYYDQSDTIKYQMPLTSQEKQSGYRALHYCRYRNNSQLETVRRIVPFYDISLQTAEQTYKTVSPEQTYKTVSPLYEPIGPSLLDNPGSKNDFIVFWTNIKDVTIPVDAFGSYVYKTENIHHFDETNLDEADLESSSTRMLCSALIGWDILKSSGTVTTDINPEWTPIILSVNILSINTDGLAVDFSSGSGTGIGRHNHSNNDQGGFAYAVFAPGTSLTPINWT